MKYVLAFLPFLFLFSACRQQTGPELQQELSEARIRLQELETELQQARAGQAKGKLEHIVFLKLKESLSAEETSALINTIKKLGDVEGVNNLEVGKMADTGDERFITDHNLAFRMDFASMADYRSYMGDTTHEAIRESLKPYLAGPPAVYDYWIEP